MRGFFHPQSVVVIGVSPKPTNMGLSIAANLIDHRFGGRLHFVGRAGGNIFGQPIQTDLAAIDDQIDLAVILTPAQTVPGFVEECGRLGIKRVIIESGGFSEFGDRGAELETKLTDLAREYDLRFIGPNCIGTFNLHNGAVFPFPRIDSYLPKGNVGIIAQSGGIGLTYVNALTSEGLGISKFASVGNKLNVDECDLLECCLEDEMTDIVCLYLESISDGRRLVELASQSDKPVVIHKSNTSALSARIAASHTAALSADDKVVDAALAEAGIFRVREVRETVNLAKMLSLPPLRGKRLGVVSRSGGHAVIAADVCAQAGLELPPLPQEFLDQVEAKFRGGVIKIQNPVDLGDLFDFLFYTDIAKGVLSQESIDGLLFVHGYRGPETAPSRQFIAAAADLARQFDKPAAFCLMTKVEEQLEVKKTLGYPVFALPEEVGPAFVASLQAWQRRQAGPPAPPEPVEIDLAGAQAAVGDGPVGLAAAFRAAEAAGLPVAQWREVSSPAEAAEAAEELGWPVAIKAAHPAISHKSDVGGVKLGIADQAQLDQALVDLQADLQAAGQDHPWPVVVQAMAGDGVEMIIGGRRDPSFGPVVLVGFGGVAVEAWGDVALGLAPLSRDRAEKMIDGLQGAKLLSGFRGRPAVDKPALVEALLRVGALLAGRPEIKELDFNPVLVHPRGQGLTTVDARIITEKD